MNLNKKSCRKVTIFCRMLIDLAKKTDILIEYLVAWKLWRIFMKIGIKKYFRFLAQSLGIQIFRALKKKINILLITISSTTHLSWSSWFSSIDCLTTCIKNVIITQNSQLHSPRYISISHHRSITSFLELTWIYILQYPNQNYELQSKDRSKKTHHCFILLKLFTLYAEFNYIHVSHTHTFSYKMKLSI